MVKLGSTAHLWHEPRHREQVTSEPAGTIEIFRDRPRVGGLRLGKVTVSVDGARVGTLRPLEELRLSLSPGTHTMRLRRWWFRSRAVTTAVREGQRTRFKAGAPERRTKWRLLFSPSSSLSLLQWPD